LLLENKNAVITGCNKGIGLETLRLFAKNGANVWACARKDYDYFLEEIDYLKNKYSVEIWPIYFDLNESDQIIDGFKEIKNYKKPIDVLVNNAGLIFTALFQMTSQQKLEEMFKINYFSHMLLTQYVSRLMMKQKKGNIINISSSAAIEGNEGRTGYASAKAAVISTTKVLAKELSAFNIRVNAVAPGLTQTEMMENSTPDDALAETLNRICLKRVGRPEEIANSILFLASDMSSYMTSQVLRVDGGM
tara:strand:+ start:36 stop:779 length:744 start_codon:yes stop_codon:yes gene_type:complete